MSRTDPTVKMVMIRNVPKDLWKKFYDKVKNNEGLTKTFIRFMQDYVSEDEYSARSLLKLEKDKS